MPLENQVFLIENYDRKQPFSSFLPGINGFTGIPMWCFYVNRGQCVTSFGIRDKDHSIMEFCPAHQAYMRTDLVGFRTFLKINGKYAEGFQNPSGKRDMYISANSLGIEDKMEEGVILRVDYITLPEEPMAALIRKITITNSSGDDMELEIADGMAEVVPYGVDISSLKEMGQTVKAWMEVNDSENRTPKFKARASIVDTACVTPVTGSYFAHALLGQELLPVIVDRKLMFESDLSLRIPLGFLASGTQGLMRQEQNTKNDMPCCFFLKKTRLKAGESIVIFEMYGAMEDACEYQELLKKTCQYGFFEKKELQAELLAKEVTDVIDTHTGNPVFDGYCRQSYLDNILRGGFPIQLGEKVFYTYSRKHGDIERDYNYFSILSEPYTQGNGNFRDVNQNRRCDVLFSPFTEDRNIKYFYNCIQINGYNPLGIEKTYYEYHDAEGKTEELPEAVRHVTAGRFTPGMLYSVIHGSVKEQDRQKGLFVDILNHSEEHSDTSFREGYWSDHWTYNLDLVESYLAVYPDKERELLFLDSSYTYRQCEKNLLPRRKRYVKTERGIRQYHFLEESGLSGQYLTDTAGCVVTSTLAAKIFLLCVTKTAALDPYGMGIEMEGGKPGWYDALNGLPGLSGSSMAETLELERNLEYLYGAVKKYRETIEIPEELYQLAAAVQKAAGCGKASERYHAINVAKEYYWVQTAKGVSGKTKLLGPEQSMDLLENLMDIVTKGIKRARGYGHGIIPTYFSYEVTSWDIVLEEGEEPEILPLAFRLVEIPGFLEGPVHLMKLLNTPEERKELYGRIKTSGLYDEKLEMYKVNMSLQDASLELGRAKIFTPGWLENESIWLHMEYKYLLELLKGGMYESFFEDFKKAGVPFMDEAVYGRSLLENSSFIASSANPDKSIHGKGFVARLSGSTAEFLSMWQIMMFGKNPFRYENGKLSLCLMPAFPSYLIGKDGTITASFLGHIKVTYHLPDKGDFYPGNYVVKSCRLADKEGRIFTAERMTEELAYAVRNGRIHSIDIIIIR